MADEIKLTEGEAKTWRGDLQLFKLDANTTVSQTIDSSATQDDSAAFADTTNILSVLNTGDACNIMIWDTAGTITAANSFYLPGSMAYPIVFHVRPGQIISSKQV